MIIIKNENAQTSGPVPEGNHAAIVVGLDPHAKTARGDVIIKVELENPQWGNRLRDTIFTWPQTKLKEFLTACNIAFAPGQNLKLPAEMCINKVVRVEVVHREGTGNYAGRTFANISHYSPADQEALAAFGFAPTESDEPQTLAEAPATGGEQTKPADDVPF